MVAIPYEVRSYQTLSPPNVLFFQHVARPVPGNSGARSSTGRTAQGTDTTLRHNYLILHIFFACGKLVP